ncbi:helix-turn-helix domain-containing protein [Pelosinus fermentans]|uniref:Helix-turn-helix domain protein n=1 Tax=Pelosinus fermentans JBW45 TaxID=1192197 RepID=I9NS37_9FIRM|nr:helix-turn-helix transcriptional regulator [Pelosinus fermentans]AJQ27564.1 helix-turn-helix domain protein [Pelosinus fermentans JBW45]
MIYTDMRTHHNLDNTVFNGKFDQNIEMTIGNTSNKRIRWARIQKGWLIKTLAAKVEIAAAHLSQLEGKTTGTAEMKTLRKLATELEQPIWFIGCFENMPEDTFFEKLEKARCYHGHTKVEMAEELGIHQRTIFDWKDKEPGQVLKKKALLYCKILD